MVKCDECKDDTVARMWCVDYEKALCDKCFKPHNKFKLLKSQKTNNRRVCKES